MRDYKKIYDELLQTFLTEKTDYITHLLYEEDYTEWLFGKYTEIDKRRKAELTTLLHNLYEDTPNEETANLFNYIFSNINTASEWVQTSIDDGYWEDVFESYKTPDEQIEAVCKKYAYLEWWAKTINCLLLCEHKSRPLAPIYKVHFNEYFINNTIQLFDYYHKTIIPQKALSEIKETPNKEISKNNIHFNPSLNEKTAIAIFNELVEKGFLNSDSKLSLWIVACGYVSPRFHDHLDWIGEVQALAYMIDKYIGKNDNNKWEITKGLFTIKGKEPNINSMKNICSGVKNDGRDRPQIFDTIDDIFTRNKIK